VSRRNGFTLMEIMIAMFVLSVVISLVFASLDGVLGSADHVNAQSDILEMGQTCMERIAADLDALHIMTYPRYAPPGIDDDDEDELYRIEGEAVSMGGETFAKLRFASLAHLPLNQVPREGIAEIVYYILETEDSGYTLRRKDTLYPYPEFEEDESDPILCEQVHGFKVLYYDHEDREVEDWNSQSNDVDYATPVAIAFKLTVGDETSPMILSRRIKLPVHRFKELKR
jgi:general secretion pathway protein J